MTNLPDDLLDPVEARLSRRVRDYSDAAVAPIDAMAIASAVATGHSRRFPSFARLGLVLAGAAAVAVAVVVGMGTLVISRPPIGPGGLGPSASPPGVTVTDPCPAGEISARILGWEGAAGSRTTDLEVTNVGSAECWIPATPRLRLVDAAGSTLIEGPASAAGPSTRQVRLAPAAVLHAMVLVNNYCGAPAVDPASVVLEIIGGSVSATPVATEVSGIPPCNGPNAESHITMTDWERGPAAP